MATDRRIGVLMGGVSAEREVSLKSGAAVFNALKSLGYDVTAVDVGSDICETLKREKIEVAFLTLHGGHGENGSLQGLLEVLGILYTGSGVLASALAMDKEMSKRVFACQGIPAPPFVTVQSSTLNVNGLKENFVGSELGAEFDLPWVIKPATEGSSIGVSIIRDKSSLAAAMEKAFSFSERVIVERFVQGKEIQTGIFNDSILGSVEVRPKCDFYSYEAKYTPGLTEYILPPVLPQDYLQRAEKAALSAHRALGCRGATRVDLIVDANGSPFVLEVNTIPGMTETSLLPKIADSAGLDFRSLVEEILEEAVKGKKET
jgi:D-alanine-D-alanine ligase